VFTHTNQGADCKTLEQREGGSGERSVEVSEALPLLAELSFGVTGQAIPVDHGYQLFSALAHFQPELHNLSNLSIQTITNTTFKSRKLLLTKYSKLRVRLPVEKVPLIYSLAGRSIMIGGDKVRFNIPSIDLLCPSKTLYSRMVVIKGKDQPEPFLVSAKQKLNYLGIEGAIKISLASNGTYNRKTLKVRGYTVVGFSLEVTNLNDDDSLKLQSYGIGAKRKMGCGIFVPK